MKEAEAHAKMLEYEQLVSEKMALEDAQEQIRCKEEDRAKRKRMGYYTSFIESKCFINEIALNSLESI